MGVTIHYRLGQYKAYVPKMLDEVQKQAEDLRDNLAKKVGVTVEVTRHHPYRLAIDMDGCETLMFGFGSMKHWQEKEGWGYEKSTLGQTFRPEILADDRLMFASAFCKTQYAEKLVEHKWVADLLRLVAGRCHLAEVSDEGDYYHSGVIEDAAKAIGANGAMIAQLGAMLRGEFGADNVVSGGETKIKPTIPNKENHGKTD